MATFNELKISDSVKKAIDEMGFEEATPIQAQAIPLAMDGKDIIGQAQTGTGKTAAFGIPMVEAIDPQSTAIQGIVVVPTRELALQVAEELNKIGHYKGIYTVPIYGGQDIRWQIKALKNKPHIIAGTPGRLIDHLVRRRTIRADEIRIAILDEADEMLDMGFIEDIETILETTPKNRQTMLFSATVSGPVEKLAQKFMKSPIRLSVGEKSVTVSATEQAYLEVLEKQKFDVLSRLLDVQLPELAIVFVRTKRRVDELAGALSERGYPAAGIHGDMLQSKRENTLNMFRSGKIDILVATDVAARGLDIPGVTHIYNFDIPQDTDSYVHRIGRTGRAGKAGMATTFVTPREFKLMRMIEHVIKRQITRIPIPSMAEAREEKVRVAIEKLQSAAENKDISFYRGYAEGMLEVSDSVALIAAALSLLDKGQETAPVELTEALPSTRPSRRPPRRDEGRRDEGRPQEARRPQEAPRQQGGRGPKKYGDRQTGMKYSRRK
jgi:ATP-dependent RNA helicase DeaD